MFTLHWLQPLHSIPTRRQDPNQQQQQQHQQTRRQEGLEMQRREEKAWEQGKVETGPKRHWTRRLSR